MKRILFLLVSVMFCASLTAQIGINNTDPATALDIKGAVRTRPVSFEVNSNAVAINAETSLALLTGTATGPVTITVQAAPVEGQRLTIHNTITGGFDATLADVSIPQHRMTDLIFSNGQWKSLQSTSTQRVMMINVADSGIYPDDVDRSVRIRQIIDAANGTPLFFPPGKYKFDGNVITTANVHLLGIMPVYQNGSLGSGTIFLNKMSFTSIHAVVEGFGVQLSTPDDGFRITPPINTGKYCRVRNIITVGANTTSAFHSFLMEGFDYLYADNIECYNGYMGQVIKVKSGNLSNFRDVNIAKESVFLKSDNISSNCKNLTLNGVHIENTNAGTSTGIKVNSAGAQFQNLSIDNVQIQRVQFGIAVISSGGIGIAINNLNFSNVKIDGTSLKCIYLEANSGFVYKTNLSNFDVTAVGKSLLETVGNIKFLNISNFNADITAATTVAEKEQIIKIGATTKATNISNLNITKGYAADDDLAVFYGNPESENRIQQYNVRLKGNKPQPPVSTLNPAGAIDNLQPAWNGVQNQSLIEINTPVAGTSIQSIAKTVNPLYPTEFFPKGWILTLRNAGSGPLTLLHSTTGNIFNPLEQNIEIPARGVLQYIFDGTYWTPLAVSVSDRRRTAVFNGGGELIMDNIKVTLPSAGNKSLQLSAVTGEFYLSGNSIVIASGTDAGAVGTAVTPQYWKVQNRAAGALPEYWQADLSLSQSGDSQQIYFTDHSNQKTYKISLLAGEFNRITIERE